MPTLNGAAWFRALSGKSAGLLQVTAAVDDLSARRAVQQVASDPCNLRITGQRTKVGITVQTEPVPATARGNSVPDGTIVTFTATTANGKSSVDAPIKRGIAQAQMLASGAALDIGAPPAWRWGTKCAWGRNRDAFFQLSRATSKLVQRRRVRSLPWRVAEFARRRFSGSGTT